MQTREEKKRQTRQALIQSALDWVDEGKPLASLSIREIAKRAGVVPTAFYRHFQDVEDLALSLVDELSQVLRRLLREVRSSDEAHPPRVRDYLDQYCHYVLANRVWFVFLVQAMTGGTLAVRRAIRSELHYFAHELALDMRRLDVLPNLSLERLEDVMLLALQTAAFNTSELVDLPAGHDALLNDFKTHLRRQIQLIFVGARHWRERD